jgi:outer membrane lipoprotein carrier protein
MRILLVMLALTSLVRADLDTKPLESWLTRQKDLKSLDAAFTQERKLPSLKNPVESPGRLRMMRPGKLLWELGDPVKTMAVSDGKSMTLVQVDKKRGKRIDTQSGEAKQFTMLSDEAFHDLASFEKTFELKESSVTDGIYQLTVRPLDPAIRTHVPWMFLDIDLKTWELRAMEIQLEDKSRIRTIFTKTKINATLDPAIFTPDLTGFSLI